VAGGIAMLGVSLRFLNHPAAPAPHQAAPDQFAGANQNIALEK